MSDIFVGQFALRLQLTCNQDITSAKTRRIYYKKPNNSIGYWTAAEGDTATGVIYYDFTSPIELPTPGMWKFWTYIEFTDNRIATGKVVEYEVKAVGSV